MVESILIVEDEQIVAMDLELILGRLGYQVAGIATSGRSAIDQAAQGRPDLILMDVLLRGPIDGIEAALEIRARQDVPVIYLTAYNDEATRRRAGETAPYGYLVKPFDERTVQTTIEMALIRHRADQQVRFSEQRFATALAAIQEGVIITDAEGAVSYLNAGAARMLQIDDEAAIGRPAGQLVAFFDALTQAQLPDPVLGVLATHSEARSVAALLRTPAGAELLIEYSAAPIALAPDAVMGVALVLCDCSQRRQVEAERLERQRQLEQIRYLEQLQIQAGNTAHALNNLLVGIIGYSELLATDCQPDQPGAAMIGQLHELTRRAIGVSRELLTHLGRGR